MILYYELFVFRLNNLDFTVIPYSYLEQEIRDFCCIYHYVFLTGDTNYYSASLPDFIESDNSISCWFFRFWFRFFLNYKNFKNNILWRWRRWWWTKLFTNYSTNHSCTHVQVKCTVVGTSSTEYVLLMLMPATRRLRIELTKRWIFCAGMLLRISGNKLKCLIDIVVHNLWHFQNFTFDGNRL